MSEYEYLVRGLCGAPVPTASTTTIFRCCLAYGHAGRCWSWGAE
jgi:hypothetical protein